MRYPERVSPFIYHRRRNFIFTFLHYETLLINNLNLLALKEIFVQSESCQCKMHRVKLIKIDIIDKVREKRLEI